MMRKLKNMPETSKIFWTVIFIFELIVFMYFQCNVLFCLALFAHFDFVFDIAKKTNKPQPQYMNIFQEFFGKVILLIITKIMHIFKGIPILGILFILTINAMEFLSSKVDHIIKEMVKEDILSDEKSGWMGLIHLFFATYYIFYFLLIWIPYIVAIF